MDVVSRVICNQPKLTQAMFFAIIFLLCGVVESNPGPTFFYETFLAVTKKSSENIKIFHLDAQSVVKKKSHLNITFSI